MCYINLNWIAIGVVFAGCGIIASIWIATRNWKKTSEIHHLDICRDNSKFYLQQAKSYFKEALELLMKAKNNNVKWHQAAALLQNADDIKNQLTEQPHKNIYCLDYINTGYALIDIIKRIDDFRFFYGLPNYKGRTSEELYQESMSQDMKNISRISPDSLACLYRFIDKAGKTSFDLNKNKTALEKEFDQEFFQKNVNCDSLNAAEYTELCTGSFTSMSIPVLVEYIKDYKTHEKKQK